MSQPVPFRFISVMKAFRNHANVGHISPRLMERAVATPTTRTLLGPPQIAPLKNLPSSQNTTVKITTPFSFYANPCVDLFFHAREGNEYSQRDLKQLLPLAWSHDPLTTLKLICNLVDSFPNGTGKHDEKGFYTAANWLHQNHPKTLACNVGPIAGLFGHLIHFLEILYRILEGEKIKYPRFLQMIKDVGSTTKREEILAMAKKATEKYLLDPDYRFLHDRVSDLFAHCLKSDIQNFNLCNGDERVEITIAAMLCPDVDSYYDRATLLCDSIAQKVFPRGSEVQEEEADYAYRVREQLMKEVLVPLREAWDDYDLKDYDDWGFSHRYWRRFSAVQVYMEAVRDDNSNIKAGALLPNQIISCVQKMNHIKSDHYGQAPDLQWKKMVDEIYLKQGKLKNCLVAYDVRTLGVSLDFGEASFALALLTSQLSEEPWKGKIISFSFGRQPQLKSILGADDDLKSKCKFMRSLKMDPGEECPDFNLEKVFDLILEVAVKGNLKPEQMIKKVFVLTGGRNFHEDFGAWKSEFEAIQSKFKENGYGDVVPKTVFWNFEGKHVPSYIQENGGMYKLSGYNQHLFKIFLDKDGENILPHHVMEAHISDERYQTLAVVD